MISAKVLGNYSIGLQKRIDSLQAQIEKQNNEYDKERLIVRAGNNGNYKYYASRRDENGKVHEEYLKDNIEKAMDLAMRDCANIRLKDAYRYKKAVDGMLSALTDESLFSQYMASHPGQAELINERIKQQGFENLRKEDKEIFEAVEAWKKIPYQRNQQYPEELTHKTCVPGLYVRSKSERDMVSLFESKHVAYHYEEPFLGINDFGQTIIIYPDFTCMNMRVGKLIIVEHLGFCDDAKYMETFYQKLKVYNRAGFFLGENLVITYETKHAPLDINTINWVIDNWLV